MRSEVSHLEKEEDLSKGGRTLCGIMDSFLAGVHSSLFYFAKQAEMGRSCVVLQENFHKFRRTVWRDRLQRLSRKELAQAALDSGWKNDVWEYYQDWFEELVCAWELMVGRYPTFVLYFEEDCRFTAESLKAFVTALKRLEEKELGSGYVPRISLFLGGNAIDDEGAVILSQAMGSLKTLAHLDLKNNQIGEKGVKALAQSLHYSDDIKVLDLSRNAIPESAVLDLAKALGVNRSLKCLSLSTDCVSVRAAKAFEMYSKENQVLEHLDIWN